MIAKGTVCIRTSFNPFVLIRYSLGEPIRIVVESFIPRAPAPRDDDAPRQSIRNGHTALKDRIARTPLIHRLTDDNNTTTAAEEKINA